MLRTVVLRPTQFDPVLGSAVDTWATVAVAIGTIGTVVYALFRDYFVTARRRPRLDLRFDRAGNDQVVIETEGGSDAAYARLRVANQPGKDTADDDIVMVTELRRLGDEEAATTAETRPIGLLDLSPRPVGSRDLLDSGRYEIAVEVRARNADAIGYAISVGWDGKWSGRDAMWDHLRVEPPRKVR